MHFPADCTIFEDVLNVILYEWKRKVVIYVGKQTGKYEKKLLGNLGKHFGHNPGRFSICIFNLQEGILLRRRKTDSGAHPLAGNGIFDKYCYHMDQESAFHSFTVAGAAQKLGGPEADELGVGIAMILLGSLWLKTHLKRGFCC